MVPVVFGALIFLLSSTVSAVGFKSMICDGGWGEVRIVQNSSGAYDIWMKSSSKHRPVIDFKNFECEFNKSDSRNFGCWPDLTKKSGSSFFIVNLDVHHIIDYFTNWKPVSCEVYRVRPYDSGATTLPSGWENTFIGDSECATKECEFTY